MIAVNLNRECRRARRDSPSCGFGGRVWLEAQGMHWGAGRIFLGNLTVPMDALRGW